MKCCKPNHFLFNPLSIPPDFDPPAESTPLYLYAVSVSSGLQTADYYNGVTVDGNFYSTYGNFGAFIPEEYNFSPLAKDAFQLDLALAGLTTNGNGGRASGYTPDVNLYGDQYIFFVATTQPHNISVNLLVNGVQDEYALRGGLFAYVNHCMTVTTPDPANEQVLFFNISAVDPTGVAINTFVYDVSGVTIDDPVAFETAVNERMNTVNGLFDYNVGYVDNGDGTVTVTMQIPSVDCDPPNEIMPIDLRSADTTSGTQTNTPC